MRVFLILSLICCNSLSAHTFDKSILTIPNQLTDTFTIDDPTGCTADITTTIGDPTVISITPDKVTHSRTQKFTVKGLKKGTSLISVSWKGDGNGCTEVGAHIVSVTVTGSADLSVRLVAPAKVPANGVRPGAPTLVYVTNSGPDDANQVRAEVSFLVEITKVQWAATQGSCRLDRKIVTCSLGLIKAGATVAVEVYAETNEKAGAIHVVSAAVYNAEADPNASNNFANLVVEFITAVDLQLSVNHRYAVDGTATDEIEFSEFTVRRPTMAFGVSNLSKVAATNVTIVFSLPDGVSISDTNDSDSYSVSGKEVTLRLGGLAPGAISKPVEFDLEVRPRVSPFSIQAVVSASEPDPHPYNNFATFNATIPTNKVFLYKYIRDSHVIAGKTMEFQFQIQYRGKEATRRFRLIDTLPPGFTFVSAKVSTQGTCSGTSAFACDFEVSRGRIAYIAATVMSPLQLGTYVNNASVSSVDAGPALVGTYAARFSTHVAPMNGPAFSAAGVGNSADPTKKSLTAGSDPTIYGSGLATRTAFAAGPNLPFELGGATVTVDGFPAALSYVSPGQINFQVPWEVGGLSSAGIVVTADGVSSEPKYVPVSESEPAIFTTNQTGAGQGAILIAGTAAIAAPAGAFPGSRPAGRGEYLTIYANGLGRVDGPIATGAATPSDRLFRTTQQPIVTLGGIELPVTFSGLAPYFVGLYQVNAQITDAVPLGNAVPLQLTIDGFPSNEVTVAVGPLPAGGQRDGQR